MEANPSLHKSRNEKKNYIGKPDLNTSGISEEREIIGILKIEQDNMNVLFFFSFTLPSPSIPYHSYESIKTGALKRELNQSCVS